MTTTADITPTQISQCDSLGDAFHAIYQDDEMMLCWLAAAPTVRAKMLRAEHCLAVARNPGYRFQLESVPAVVIAVVETFLAACHDEVADLRTYIRESRASGLAWDTTWHNIPDHLVDLGFTHGDSQILDSSL